MNLHFSYKVAKSPDVEHEIQQHLKKLERRLKDFSPDAVHLHGALDCGTGPKNNCEVSLNLRLPTGQISAQDSGANAQAAIKRTFAELIKQLDKHKDLLRNEHNWVHDRGELIAEEPVLKAKDAGPAIPGKANGHARAEDVGAVPDGNDEFTAATFDGEGTPLQREVREYLSKRLARLERYVQRELRLREAESDSAGGQISEVEVLDEVVVSALQTEERPQHLSLERWLFRLTVQTIRRMTSTDSNESDNIPLEKPVGEPNVTGSDEAFLQFHQPGETLSELDIIPDVRVGDPEERAASDETIDQLVDSLNGTKPSEREAFVLFAIEGFTVPEIAEITERPEQNVKADILSARNHLVKKLPPSNSLKRKLMQYSSVA